MTRFGYDTLKTKQTLKLGSKTYHYFSFDSLKGRFPDIDTLPISLKILLENLLRYEDQGQTVGVKDIEALCQWSSQKVSHHEINYRPARVLMQDFTGVPAVVDLASMRDAMNDLGADSSKINPLSPVDLVIDHSVMVDHFGQKDAAEKNMSLEFERNQERYNFLKWGQGAFNNFQIVPPGAGICHQVNVEHLAQVVWQHTQDNETIIYPDTLVGTDSHTTMVNGLSVLGWGVGGLEAEAAMLGQPISMRLPEVIGVNLVGCLQEGVSATDLILVIVEKLRALGVVGKFVEFYGQGLSSLSLPDRATISNMAPEYGATCGFFPIDEETLSYLAHTGRCEDQVELVRQYAHQQGLWHDLDQPCRYTKTLELNLKTITPCISGPKRPQDRIELTQAKSAFETFLQSQDMAISSNAPVPGQSYELNHGHVVIAAITSCTNTSNPWVLIGAGLLAQKARQKGLMTQPWVKTSLAPGSLVVADYLKKSGLQDSLDALGFHITGFGCTTCIGNSGPLSEPITQAIEENNLVVSAVLSGNRNFEGRIHSHVKSNYLTSPILVVAYALCGRMSCNITHEPLGHDPQGNPVYLKDIWPSNEEIQHIIHHTLNARMYRDRYDQIFKGPEQWQKLNSGEGKTFQWDDNSTYIQKPPYFEGITLEPAPVENMKQARSLLMLGDSITTDHISPAGAIKPDSPAGEYLKSNGVAPKDFNSYGSRRGNHQVMMRGTFANIRLRNELAPGTEGGVTRHQPSGEQMTVYEASQRYQSTQTPLVVIAGKDYGCGSSRDWAAKGTKLLNIGAVIAESFERIHRTNLVCFGVLPLKFQEGQTRQSLQLDGTETFDILGLSDLKPRQNCPLIIHRNSGEKVETQVMCCIETQQEVNYFYHGGILQYVLRQLAKS